MSKIPMAWQAAFVVMVRPLLNRIGVKVDMEAVYKETGISQSTALQTARMVFKKMFSERSSTKNEELKVKELEDKLAEGQFLISVLDFKNKNPGCYDKGDRFWFSLEFKAFVLEKKSEYELSWDQISRILDIPVDTLKKFKRSKSDDDGGDNDSGSSELPGKVRQLLNNFLKTQGSKKKSVKSFCMAHPELLEEIGMNYRQVLHWLARLGFVSSKGIFLQNTGLDKIERFQPHSVWGSDGKNMIINIDGTKFHWVWQCLVEYKTTVLVGGLIAEEETTENLLKAIQISKDKTGVTPMAIVIDNRLSENLPAIRRYLDEMGIEIIKTFPGNSKSNGIVEGNFSIFEKWVGGTVEINATNAKILSKSIADMLVEVFTQLRNHQPRRILMNKTTTEALDEAKELSKEDKSRIRARIKELADRFKNEQAQPVISERKEQVTDQIIKEINPPYEELLRKRLKASIFTPDLILRALAIFKQRQQKCPEKNYGHTYFGGILRNLADQQSIEWLCTHLEDVYYNHWENMKRVFEQDLAGELKSDPDAVFKQLSKDYLTMPVPAYTAMILLQMKSMFLLATKGQSELATKLRGTTTNLIKQLKIYDYKKRAHLLAKLFEWESIVRSYNTKCKSALAKVSFEIPDGDNMSPAT
jgi:DNA replication protein DnaD